VEVEFSLAINQTINPVYLFMEMTSNPVRFDVGTSRGIIGGGNWTELMDGPFGLHFRVSNGQAEELRILGV